MPIEPDTKDWTWAAERRCEQCGFDASTVTPADLPAAIRESARGWSDVLRRGDAGRRPSPEVWSPLEYAGHVRDVHRLFAGRVRQMLTEDDPVFAGWDQDVAAVEGRYGEADPATVLAELGEAAEIAATAYAEVGPDAWDRTARRSDGATFTVTRLGRYHLHDAVHHLHDVG